MSEFPESSIFRWNAGLVPLVASNGSISLLLEDRQIHISDPLLLQLIHLLQRPQPMESLLDHCDPAYSAAAIREAIEELHLEKLIVLSDSHSISRNSSAFWDRLPKNCSFDPVSVRCLISTLKEPLESLLKANELTLKPDAGKWVAITSDYLLPEVAGFAAAAESLLLAKPVGNRIWIGPCLSSETSLCWECLAYWMRLRRWPELLVTGMEPEEPAPVASIAWLPSTMNMALGLIATATALWAAGQSCDSFTRRMWTFDVQEFQGHSHAVVARQNCLACKAEGAVSGAARMEALSDPEFGIMGRLRASASNVGFVYLVHSSVFLPLPKPGIREMAPPLSADGKAATPEEALQRCTMEAVERYSSVFTGYEPVVRARASDLRCLSLESLMLFSDSQYEARDEWNQRPGDMHGIPERFDPETPTDWVAAYSLTDGSEWFVPAGYCHLYYPFVEQTYYNFADTNGCAAGEDGNETILRGLLEVVERDAVAIWWYNRIFRPEVDLREWKDNDVQATVTLFDAQQRRLMLLDLTNDLEVPVFAAVSSDSIGRDIYFGCGCDICPVLAAKRALAELIQFWYWSSHLGADSDRQLWLENATLDAHPYLTAQGRAKEPIGRALPTGEALKVCLDALRRSGIEAYSIDLTKPELGIPVTRVVAPGLRHYGPRFAPGRLYDTPVKMGWRQTPLTEDQMNPEPCIL